jgi:arsenite methyltransferase
MSVSPLTSTGHALSDAAWLDDHFESARTEYEECLRSVGIKPGWMVLDAGCGSGGFLPLLHELVGANGSVTALDLAPENVARVEALKADGRYPKSISTKVGSMFALPFADATFDCVWSANVMQYVTGAEFSMAAGEFQRVLKPGGTLAIKDFDASMLQFLPLDPCAVARILTVRRAKAAQSGLLGSWCGPVLPSLMRQAGIVDIRRRSWLVERWSPLEPHTRRFAKGNFALQGKLAAENGLPESDVRLWSDAAANAEKLLSEPDFCIREGFTLAVGRKHEK